jgi:hypothetical protein
MALWDTLTAVGEGLQKARDLVAADPNTLSPVDQLAREGVRAYCRAQDWIDGNIPLGASVGGRYVCGPLWDEPGNSPPPPGSTAATRVTLAYTPIAAGCVTAAPTTRVHDFPGVQTGISVSLWQFTSLCPQAIGRGYQITSTESGSLGFFNEDEQYVDAPVVQSVEYVNPAPIIGNPYAPGDPVDTPYGPITVDPQPWGPRIFLPDGDPVDLPLDPDTPPPDPTGKNPEDGPITPAPKAPAPNGDGETDFGDPPEGFEFVGCYWVITSGLGVPGVIPNTGASPVFPRIAGTVRLRCESGGAIAPSTDAVMRSQSGIVIRPAPGLTVTGAYVNTLPFMSVDVYPLLGELP